jgi:hypothetical protein
VWPEGGDVVAQPEKENLILNQNNPTTASYTYSILLSSSLPLCHDLKVVAKGQRNEHRQNGVSILLQEFIFLHE